MQERDIKREMICKSGYTEEDDCFEQSMKKKNINKGMMNTPRQ